MIIDAHSHVFPEVRGAVAAGPTRGIGYGCVDAGGQTVRVLPPYNEQTVFTPDMLLANLDWAGADKAVLLQGPFYGECNRYAHDALARHPDRLIGAAYFDPWSTNSPSHLSALLDASLFKAVKLEFSEATGLSGLHPGARLDESGVAWLWLELERRGLALVIDLGAVGSRSYQTGAVRAIAQQHPDLKIVVPHLGQPNPAVEADPERRQLWLEQIDLARLPNVWFDTAALPAYLPDEDYPFPSAERVIRLAVERVGAAKILWGSDQPGLLAHASYPQLVAMAKRHLAFLSNEEQALVLGGNAALVYGIEI